MERLLKYILLITLAGVVVGCKLDDNQLRGEVGNNSSPPPASPAPVAPSLSFTSEYFLNVGDVTNVLPSHLENIDSLSISPSLPTGMNFNTTTGEISGAPIAAVPRSTFTITAMGPGGSSQFLLTLEVGYTFNVNTTDDVLPNVADVSLGDGQCLDGNGNCSFRAAFYEAQALNPASVVINVPSGTYNITQTIGLMNLDNKIVVNGSESSSTILDGGGAIRLFHLNFKNVLEFNFMEFKNAQSTDGAVFFASSSSTTDGYLILKDCLLENNRVTTSNDRGGAISYIYPGNLHVFRSRFIGNYAYGSTNMDGGAIYFDDNSLIVSDSYFEGNYVEAGNHGGAIANRMTSGATSYLIENSTFKNNGTLSGTAYAVTLDCAGTADDCIVRNSTFIGANNNQMGIYLRSSPARLINNTFSFNNNSTILNTNSNILTNHELFGNIFENIGTGLTCNPVSGDYVSLGYNIDNKNDCNFSATGDLPSTSPQLNVAGLTDNGGLTQTILLQASSPAIDLIPENLCSSTDQRGSSRPYSYNSIENKCDVGAVEMQVGD